MLNQNLHNRHILLTGSSGFLGRAVYDRLKLQNKVSGLSRSKDAEFSHDLTSNILLLPHFDMVIHAAGKAHITSTNSHDSKLIYDINVSSTRNLLLSLSFSPPESFVFISSVAVYGCDSGMDIDETFPLNAKDAYGSGKIECERMIQGWCDSNGVRCLILRLPLVAGQNAPGNLRQMANAIRKGFYFRIGDGSALRSVVRLADVSELLAKSYLRNGVFNLGGSTHLSVSFIDQMIARGMSKSIYSLSPYIAKPLAYLGDHLPLIPLNRGRYDKLTRSLTFSDVHAREKLGWTTQDFQDTDFLFDKI
jgi:nucleoside-diphosphate-sugar epimerase